MSKCEKLTDDEKRRAVVATAIFDALNTARLSEHPEEAEEYGQYADGFILWLKVAGYRVIRARTGQARAITEGQSDYPD